MRSLIASGFLVLLLTTPLTGADKTVSGQFITEPPTLISLGFEWEIAGDDNRSAEVAVWYRKKGEQVWKQGLPLLRLQQERINRGPLQYTTPNMFAGSLFDLEPGTEYEGRFVLTDPDGVEGRSEQIVTVRTRVEPRPFPGGRVYHVYPPGYNGTRQEPAFTGLLAAYYTGSSNSDNHNTMRSSRSSGIRLRSRSGRTTRGSGRIERSRRSRRSATPPARTSTAFSWTTTCFRRPRPRIDPILGG